MKKYSGYIFIFLIVLLTLRVFVPQLDQLKESLLALKDADLRWLLLGTLVYFTGPFVLALQVNVLALKRLVYMLTLKVQLAGMFVSKLLPSGVGTITLNIYYMMKRDHTANEATTVMTMNALTSAIGYSFLIVLALTQSTISLEGLEGEVQIPTNLILFIAILLAGAIITFVKSDKVHAKVKNIWKDLKVNFASYKERPGNIFVAIVCNALGSAANVVVMYTASKAIGADMTLAEGLLAYTFGNIAATLVPTPGGLGAAEAGIYSGLVLVGIEGTEALSITLLYRLINFWLPVIPGYYFFVKLRKDLLSDFNMKKRYNGEKPQTV